MKAAICAVFLFTIFAAPSASAQVDESTETLDSGDTLTTETLITNGGDSSVVTETLTAADGCSADITVTFTDVVGGEASLTVIEEYDGVREVVGFARASLETTVTEEAVELACVDEVLGITLTPELAITGSDVNGPVALGAAMIGVGGILVGISKRRQDDDS